MQISKKQGFPEELDYEQHIIKPFQTAEFEGRIFEFKDKPKIRIYQMPPVRNFLAQNIDGKWLYWGHIEIVEIVYDYVKQTTSGKFKITYINSIDEMKYTHQIINRTKETDFLNMM